MKLDDYIRQELTENGELLAMLESNIVGAGMRNLEVSPFDSRTFRQHASKYADSGEGPFGQGRLDLYYQIGDLFESLRSLPGNEELKGYELKDSFMGGEEADLVMLTASHEKISQEELAHDVLRCSKNAVGDRRARMRDGIRIGGMSIQAEFGYRGEFQSSVHPISLPLNLSEVYVLFDALAEYAHERDGRDPHRMTAERLAGMLKFQLSDYAKERLQARLQEMGFDELEEIAPVFSLDSPTRDVRNAEEAASPMHWAYFEKAGIRVRVERTDGSSTVGVILPSGRTRQFIEERGIDRKDKRPYCIVYRTDGDYDIVPWADVVDVRRDENVPEGH